MGDVPGGMVEFKSDASGNANRAATHPDRGEVCDNVVVRIVRLPRVYTCSHVETDNCSLGVPRNHECIRFAHISRQLGPTNMQLSYS